MIAKDTTVAVNFMVLNTDGFPATGKAASISATISINGAQATSISDTITEKGSGWYYFNHAFGTAGNVFIEFSATGCTIEPWEDEVINMASGSAPSAADIATAVWSYEDDNNIYHPRRTIYGAEGSNYSIYSIYGDGHDSGLVESIWGYDPSALITATSAGKRLVDIQTNAARPGDAMTLTTAYNAAKTASQFNASTDTVTINSTQAATMVTATGFATPANVTTAQTAIINAMPSTTGLATSSDISTAQTAIINAMPSTTGLATGSDVSTAQAAIIAAMPDISGLSTFDPANDTVLIDSTQAATMATATGFATPSDLAGLSTFNAATDRVLIDATQAATMTTATGFATPSDLAGLSTFNAATDRVLIDATQAATMTTATGFATPSDLAGLSTFDPANDTVLIDSTQAAGMATATGFATPSDLAGLSTFNPSTDRVLVDATQAATMVTATGFATPSDITAAVTEIETHGDNNWTGGGQGGGGATAQQIWEYPTRTLSAATLPNNSALATAANVDAAVTALETYGQTNWITATGFATPSDLTGLSTFDPTTTDVNVSSASISSIQNGLAKTSELPSVADIAAGVWGDNHSYTGRTKGATLSTIAFNVDDLPTKVWCPDLSTYDTTSSAGYQVYTALNNCATGTDISVLAELQKDLNAGVLNWNVTADALTIYNDNGTTRATYTLTRDEEGNITRIQPNS